MALSTFAHANQLTQKSWNKGIFKITEYYSILASLAGPVGSGMPIIVNNELKNRPGDQVILDQIQELDNAGIGDGGFIEDNEEAGEAYNMPVIVHERGNGVRAGSPISQKRTRYSKGVFLNQFGMALGRWAGKQIDNDLRWALSGLGNQNTYVGQGSSDIETVNELAPSSLRHYRGGQDYSATPTVTWVDTILEIGDGAPAVLSCLFGMGVIRSMQSKMELMEPQILPIRMKDGRFYWLWMLHPLQAKHLRLDSNWNDNQQSANVRSLKDNPLWGNMDFGVKHSAVQRPILGAIGIVGNFILMTYQKIEDRVAGEVFSDSGDAVHANIVDGTYRVCRSLILGQEAGIISWGKAWMPHTKDFDYGRFPGMAMDSMYGTRKMNFRSPGVDQDTNTSQQDMGVVVVDTVGVD